MDSSQDKPSPSETPRTDALEQQVGLSNDVLLVIRHARNLERELGAAQTNFRVTNASYCKLDEETRELRGSHFADENGRGIASTKHALPCNYTPPSAIGTLKGWLVGGNFIPVHHGPLNAVQAEHAVPFYAARVSHVGTISCPHGTVGYCEPCALVDPGELGEHPPRLAYSAAIAGAAQPPMQRNVVTRAEHDRATERSSIAFTKEDAAKIVERKARALTEEYCHGDGGPDGYTWTNKEAEWQVILLEELAEEFRNVA